MRNVLHVPVVSLVLWLMQNPFDHLYRDHDIENMSDGYALCPFASVTVLASMNAQDQKHDTTA